MIPISQVGKLMLREVKAVVALGPLWCAVSRIGGGGRGAARGQVWPVAYSL